MKKCNSATVAFLATAALAVLAVSSSANAGTYRTINTSGSESQFAGITATTVAPNGSAEDPYSVKIANDRNYLYLDIDYYTPVNPYDGTTATVAGSGSGLYLAIDSDNNPNTGYPDNGSIGANVFFQNANGYTQTATSFNTGDGLTSASSTVTGIPIYAATPYDVITSEQIISLPLDLTETDLSTDSSTGVPVPNGYNGLVFPSTFNLELFTNGTGNDVILGPISYTLASAAVPEPTSLSLLACGGALMLRRRRLQTA